MDDEIIKIIQNEDDVIIVDQMNDSMKKEVLLSEMKRVDELVPFINKGILDTFNEDEILIVIRKNTYETQQDMIQSKDKTYDYTFTLRTDTGKIIGEMVYDEEELEELRNDPNAYFMSDNFVTYQDNTTQGEKQYFLVEAEKSTFITHENLSDITRSFKVAVPSIETDHYIKECYNMGEDKNIGTLIVGYTTE